MKNVALRLDLGFLSLVSESPVKIFGNEIAREIHDMNCELVETALRLQKKIAEDSKFKLTRADREKLLSTNTGKGIYARYCFAEGQMSQAKRVFEKLAEDSQNIHKKGLYLYECWVVAYTKSAIDRMTKNSEKSPENPETQKTRRTLARNYAETSRIGREMLNCFQLDKLCYPHIGAHILYCYLEGGHPQRQASFMKVNREDLSKPDWIIRALEASCEFNKESVENNPRSFDLGNFRTRIRRNSKDSLYPSFEIFPVPEKHRIQYLVLDLLNEYYSGQLRERSANAFGGFTGEEALRLIRVYGRMVGKPGISEEECMSEIRAIGNPDEDRYKSLKLILDCFRGD